MCSRGKGTLPHEASLIEVANPVLHVSCCKPASGRRGVVVRVVNPSAQPQPVSLRASAGTKRICRIGMAEDRCDPVAQPMTIAPKKIETYLVEWE
jgi:alpha-mannosidase